MCIFGKGKNLRSFLALTERSYYMSKFTSLLALSLISTVSLTACGQKQETGSEKKAVRELDASVREHIRKNANSTDLLTGELENKKIKWLSTWDINPDESGKNVPTELAVFQERYGGEIECIKVEYKDRYDRLSQAINGGEGIDFFYAGDLDAFPKGAIRSMFQPADDYVDFDSPLWDDVRDFNDGLEWNGKHYAVAVQVTGDYCSVIYNRKTVQEAGLPDPAELYYNNEWTWDTFEDMLDKFVDPSNQRYGIDGWWFEFGLIGTIGVPAVSLDNGVLVNNIGSPEMERVQNWMYKLYNNNFIAIGSEDYGWEDKPSYIAEGKTLFYPCGLYQFYNAPEIWKKNFGEDVFFVPMPRDPNADNYYIPVGMEAYTIVEGADNPEGVGKFLECKRFVLYDDDTRAICDKQMYEDYGWTDEMIKMKDSMYELALANPVIDVSKGITQDCGELIDNSLRLTTRGVPWNETYDSISAVVEKYIDDVNKSSNQ